MRSKNDAASLGPGWTYCARHDRWVGPQGLELRSREGSKRDRVHEWLNDGIPHPSSATSPAQLEADMDEADRVAIAAAASRSTLPPSYEVEERKEPAIVFRTPVWPPRDERRRFFRSAMAHRAPSSQLLSPRSETEKKRVRFAVAEIDPSEKQKHSYRKIKSTKLCRWLRTSINGTCTFFRSITQEHRSAKTRSSILAAAGISTSWHPTDTIKTRAACFTTRCAIANLEDYISDLDDVAEKQHHRMRAIAFIDRPSSRFVDNLTLRSSVLQWWYREIDAMTEIIERRELAVQMRDAAKWKRLCFVYGYAWREESEDGDVDGEKSMDC